MSMTEETTVPVLMIDDDWSVDDVETIEDCEDAFLVLSEQIASLESDCHRAHSYFIDYGKRAPWHDSALLNLRMKKAALSVLQNKKAKINRMEKQKIQDSRDRKLLDLIKETEPEAFKRALERFLVSNT